MIAGEIQVRGLGMAVAILDETGTPVTGEQGELCCVAPFPLCLAQPLLTETLRAVWPFLRASFSPWRDATYRLHPVCNPPAPGQSA